MTKLSGEGINGLLGRPVCRTIWKQIFAGICFVPLSDRERSEILPAESLPAVAWDRPLSYPTPAMNALHFQVAARLLVEKNHPHSNLTYMV